MRANLQDQMKANKIMMDEIDKQQLPRLDAESEDYKELSMYSMMLNMMNLMLDKLLEIVYIYIKQKKDLNTQNT